MEEFPLQSLFTRLQKAGMPLGLNDYKLLLMALQGGFGVRDRIALRQLCHTLWTKSPEDRRLFDYHFDRIMPQPQPNKPKSKVKLQRRILVPMVVLLGFFFGAGITFISAYHLGRRYDIVPNSIQLLQGFSLPKFSLGKPHTIVDEKSLNWRWGMILGAVGAGGGLASIWILSVLLRKQSKSSTHDLSIQGPSKATRPTDDIVKISQSLRLLADKALAGHFLSTGAYLPVTQRQMKRSWRYLSRLAREGVPTELDIDATVRSIGRCGMFFDLILVPPRANRTSLMLLVDCGGSMIPFQSLSQSIVDTAKRGGNLGRLGVYYFQNCPSPMWNYKDDYLLYSDIADPGSAERVSKVLERFISPQLSVLIFSDAGAARGGFSDYRIKQTQKFLITLGRGVRNVVWLNPLPKPRWRGTTADKIANQVSMFEFDRLGLDSAISVLRGKNRKTEWTDET